MGGASGSDAYSAAYVSHYGGARDQRWTTPRDFFERLHARFGFTMDGAAEDGNALLPRYVTHTDLFVTWDGERVFCNPPWSRIRDFVELAAQADLAVLLVPARTNARWFHRALELGASVELFQGRPRFGDGKGPSPVDCVLLVFEKEADLAVAS